MSQSATLGVETIVYANSPIGVGGQCVSHALVVEDRDEAVGLKYSQCISDENMAGLAGIGDLL
jgi:hypothetical protein